MYEAEAKRALDLTARIIAERGPRLAGSDACLAAAEDLRAEAAKSADQVWTEDFSVHPGAFLGFIRVLVVLYILADLALPFAPSLSALLTSLGLAILVLGFFLYIEVLDPFYPGKTGRNVVAVLEPRGKAERQFVVSGHHDSARIFNFYVDRPELYPLRIYGGMGSFAALWLASLALAVAGSGQLLRIVVALAFLLDLVLVLPLWKFASREGTPGAGDNLAASAAALAALEALRAARDSGSPLESTRVVFASFDAEEAGLRGARAWARARRAGAAALPTFCLNMDCMYSAGDMRFLSSDVNGSVRLDLRLARACADAARAEGAGHEVSPIAFMTGGTDAAELARVGMRATTLIGMRWATEARAAAYHTPRDEISAVEPEVLRAAVAIALRIARQVDAGELD